MSSEVRRELQRLLSLLCEGELNQTQHARLEELLLLDAETRRMYLDYMDMHARLLVHPQLGGSDQVPPLGREDERALAGLAAPRAIPNGAQYARPRGQKLVFQLLRYGVVAAATLAASLLVQAIWRPQQAPVDRHDDPRNQEASSGSTRIYVATLTQMAGCVWEQTGEPWRVGSRLPPCELRLREGAAHIRFDSGPDLVVEGPAFLRLHSSTETTLVRGKVVFKADESAAPFNLRTPSSTLEDLGTVYAVAVGAESEEIHVFDGEVRRTPRSGTSQTEPERLTAGEARRYSSTSDSPGRPTALDPERFLRQLSDRNQPPDLTAGLLAYEGFDYEDPRFLQAGKAHSGFGWASPWRAGFARPINEGDRNFVALNVREGLSRPGASVPAAGGCFDYAGFAKYYRRLATPIRLDRDEVYYLSFLFRRHGPPEDPLSAVAVQLRTTDELEQDLQKKGTDLKKRLNIGVDRSNHLFTHLERVGTRTPMPLSYGETYLLVAKIVGSASNPDQVCARVYGPDEPIEREESGNWSVVGPLVESDLVFDWLEIHINSKTRQSIDEIRLGTSWSSVTAPWGSGGEPKKIKP